MHLHCLCLSEAGCDVGLACALRGGGGGRSWCLSSLQSDTQAFSQDNCEEQSGADYGFTLNTRKRCCFSRTTGSFLSCSTLN